MESSFLFSPASSTMSMEGVTPPLLTPVTAELDTLYQNTSMNTNSTIGQKACPGCSSPIFDLVLNLIIVGPMCMMGLLGNTLSILVLQKERTNQVAVLLLQALAVADNACLLVFFVVVTVFMGLYTNLPDCGQALYNARFYMMKYLTPIGYMTQTATIWMTVLLAANRYIAICRPFQAQQCLTLLRAKLQVAAVTVFSILFNLPRFFQVEFIYNEKGELKGYQPSAIGISTTFGIVYTNALYSILVLLLPFILLLVLNIQLIKELRESRRRLRRTSISRPENQDDNITFIMIIIIIVFLVCHTPDRIFQVILLGVPHKKCIPSIYYAQCFCNFFFMVNSSVNFVIYYMFRKRFRRILKTRVCGWVGNRSSDEVSMESAIERLNLQSQRQSEVNIINGLKTKDLIKLDQCDI